MKFDFAFDEQKNKFAIFTSSDVFNLIQSIFFQTEDFIDSVIFKTSTDHNYNRVIDFMETYLLEESDVIYLSMREIDLMRHVLHTTHSDSSYYTQPLPGHGDGFKTAFFVVPHESHAVLDYIIEQLSSFFNAVGWIPDPAKMYK